MKSNFGLLSFCVGLSLAGGCSPGALSDISDEDIASQWLNGEKDNSENFNGISKNGISKNGISKNGISKNGVNLTGIGYNGTSLKAVDPVDQTVEVDGTALTGIDMNGILTDGDILPMKVVSIIWNSVAGAYLYNIKGYNGTSWEWICGTDTDGTTPIAAMPIMKAYLHPTYEEDTDQSRFTFGCVNAAVAKCALWGYRPWVTDRPETYNSTTKYRNVGMTHQACQRMVRADYCGNGMAHTRNGTPIDVYDAYGIQNPDNLGGNSLEADWRPDGAHCIRHTRWGTADATKTGGLTDVQYIQANCPSRLAANDSSCNNESASTFYKANGFDLANQASRDLLRNQSYQH